MIPTTVRYDLQRVFVVTSGIRPNRRQHFMVLFRDNAFTTQLSQDRKDIQLARHRIGKLRRIIIYKKRVTTHRISSLLECDRVAGQRTPWVGRLTCIYGQANCQNGTASRYNKSSQYRTSYHAKYLHALSQSPMFQEPRSCGTPENQGN